jgi:hypothetical protein
MTDQPDRPRRTPPDDEPPVERIIRAPGHDDVDEFRAPAPEERPIPEDPPGENAAIGRSGGAGMDNPDTDHPHPSRERFRDLRM